MLLCLSADFIVILLKLESELSTESFNYFLYVVKPVDDKFPEIF